MYALRLKYYDALRRPCANRTGMSEVTLRELQNFSRPSHAITREAPHLNSSELSTPDPTTGKGETIKFGLSWNFPSLFLS